MYDQKYFMSDKLEKRAPIVVILGHVDHGKSSLLEAIKDFRITPKESGGITQHIGAYEVEHEGKKITFIDTPGHEAFSCMRSRGANVADIAILVVAAEESIKPQTKEAIQCIKTSKIPMILAINKIDKPDANPQKVKNDLLKEEIIVEDLGGDVPVVETSATKKIGIKELLELILLVSEVNDFNADFSAPAQGVIIESHLDSKRGITATVLVKNGTLKTQNIIATSSAFGKVKTIEDFNGVNIKEAEASKPVIVLGFEKIPYVGEEFVECDSIEDAKACMAVKKEKKQLDRGANNKILNIILRADVVGSLEALTGMIENLPSGDIRAQIIKSGAGPITEEDIQTAATSGARVFGFKSKPNSLAEKLADQKNVEIKTYDIIYELIDYLKSLMIDEMSDEIERRDLGKLKILKIFRTEKSKQIIGGRIIEGEVIKDTKVEVFRGEEKIGNGAIVGPIQKERKTIVKGQVDDEIGMLYKGNVKVEEGDTLLFYIEEKKHIVL